MESAFHQAKQAVRGAMSLAHPDPAAGSGHFRLPCGGVLQQMTSNQCSGSETFWNGSGSGSLVWYQDLVDPDPVPDPDLDPSLFSACLNRNYLTNSNVNKTYMMLYFMFKS
jgi:hypothetical protein